MSTFLKFTDPDDDTPVYVRASHVEAVVVIPAETSGSFGLHPHEGASENGYTRLVLSGGGGVHVAESAEYVAAELSHSGR